MSEQYQSFIKIWTYWPAMNCSISAIFGSKSRVGWSDGGNKIHKTRTACVVVQNFLIPVLWWKSLDSALHNPFAHTE